VRQNVRKFIYDASKQMSTIRCSLSPTNVRLADASSVYNCSLNATQLAAWFTAVKDLSHRRALVM